MQPGRSASAPWTDSAFRGASAVPTRSVNAIKLRIKSGKSLTYNDDVVKRTFIHFDIFVKHFEKRMKDSKKYFSQISRRMM